VPLCHIITLNELVVVTSCFSHSHQEHTQTQLRTTLTTQQAAAATAAAEAAAEALEAQREADEALAREQEAALVLLDADPAKTMQLEPGVTVRGSIAQQLKPHQVQQGYILVTRLLQPLALCSSNKLKSLYGECCRYIDMSPNTSICRCVVDCCY
jgi:hypothetical protein